MFIFCCLIKSSRRSNGPSYIGMFILYGVAIRSLFSLVILRLSDKDSWWISMLTPIEVSHQLSSFAALRMTPITESHRLASRVRAPRFLTANFLSPLFPAKHCFAHALHRALRYRARFIRTGVQNLQHLLRICFVLLSSFAHRRDPFDQMVRHLRFALDAANPRRPATLRRPLQRLWRREQFMPVIHRTHVRISWVGAPLPRRVRHHHFRLLSNLFIRLAERDCVPITLRHLPPIESRYPRRRGQHR